MYGFMAVVIIVGIACLFSSIFTVKQQTAVAIERFGKFIRIAKAGLNFKIPFIDQLAKELSLQVQQETVVVETKTEDNVFVKVHITVQYFVREEKLADAFYKLSKAVAQITSHVQDTVRGQVPSMKLDTLFVNKDAVAIAVKNELTTAMADFGYGIQSTQVTAVDPDEEVKKSMNSINAAKRDREAAVERGEAERTLLVARATAEAQSKKLQGEGIANQRKAIIEGLQQSVEIFQRAVPGATAEDVMRIVMMTQYFDTLKEIGASGKSSTIFLPHSPGGLADLQQQIATAMMSAHAASAPDADNGRTESVRIGSSGAFSGANGAAKQSEG